MPLRLTRTSSSRTPPPSSVRLRFQPLEGRTLPAAVGGGFTGGGLLGEYFANPDLAGDPAFTRRDVRVDFDSVRSLTERARAAAAAGADGDGAAAARALGFTPRDPD